MKGRFKRKCPACGAHDCKPCLLDFQISSELFFQFQQVSFVITDAVMCLLISSNKVVPAMLLQTDFRTLSVPVMQRTVLCLHVEFSTQVVSCHGNHGNAFCRRKLAMGVWFELQRVRLLFSTMSKARRRLQKKSSCSLRLIPKKLKQKVRILNREIQRKSSQKYIAISFLPAHPPTANKHIMWWKRVSTKIYLGLNLWRTATHLSHLFCYYCPWLLLRQGWQQSGIVIIWGMY